MLLPRDPAHVHQNYFSVRRGLTSETNGNGLSGRLAQAGTKIGVIRQQFETSRFETRKSDSPGILLLDTFRRPLYANDEAVLILSYPQTRHGNGHAANFLKQRIDSMLPERNGSPNPTFSTEFVSGRRHYQVRVFALKSNQDHLGPTMAVLLERKREHLDLLRAAREFHLTKREKEALELLMQGFTAKQIASRMDISPNTAKAFLRSVMFKTGASDRSGILAKILQF